MAIEFPNLSQIVLNILSILPLSCDYKQLFSKFSNMLKPYYLQIQPNIITALQCTQSWNCNSFIKYRK